MKKTFLAVLFLSLAVSVSAQNDIEGNYIVAERNLVKQGEILRYPFRGQSITYSVRGLDDKTAAVTQSVFYRGKRTFQQSFKIELFVKPDRVDFAEIWENGELEAKGYIVGEQFVLTVSERLTNYVVSKDIAIK